MLNKTAGDGKRDDVGNHDTDDNYAAIDGPKTSYGELKGDLDVGGEMIASMMQMTRLIMVLKLQIVN